MGERDALDDLDVCRRDAKTRYLVRLWDVQGASIIVAADTGVVYTNQCGGTTCAHPKLEGFLVPLRWFDEERAFALLQDWWFSPMYRHYRKHIEKIKDKLAAVLSVDLSVGCNRTHVRLDLDRIYTIEWGEAWVPVTSDYGPGILTWENSD